MTPLKKCTKCGEEKPATREFFPNRKGGELYTYCRPCKKLYDKRYYKKNKKRITARVREWIDDNRDRHNNYSRKTSEKYRNNPKNKEKIKQYAKSYSREYRKENKTKILSLKQKWRSENIERVREISRISAKNSRDIVSDSYVRNRLRQYVIAIKEPSKEIIELKKIHITLKRKQNERKNKQSVNP